MTEAAERTSERPPRRRPRRGSRAGRGGGDAVYGVGCVGALIFYIQQADGFWTGVLGVLKAIVWPAFLVYEVLQHVAG